MTSYVPSSLLRVILSAFEILEAAAERKERTKCNFFLFVFEQLKTELARVKSSHPHLIHKAAWEMACGNYTVRLAWPPSLSPLSLSLLSYRLAHLCHV